MDSEIQEFQNDIMAKYGIKSLEDAAVICREKGIDVVGIVKDVKEDASNDCIMAFTLGTAIAIRKDTKLASYVAIDIGEGIQTYLGNAFGEPKSGIDLGFEICNLLKDKEHDDTTLVRNYSECIPFLQLNNDEIYKITSEICFRIEALNK
ncbi:MAG: GGGtGRT protein [Clostridia bacterium]|nr:GGGtGRT protein [Clostridia bacterium]